MTAKKMLACCFCLACCNTQLPAQPEIIGKASYYADMLHGRTMSNGEPYHRDSMTCAHLKFPFGTILKVRNPINDKVVIVRVTDRGPFSKKYILDLSKAAARELDFIRRGFCVVEITRIHPTQIPLKYTDEEEIPELYLEYQELTLYPIPIWQQEEAALQKKPERVKVKDFENKQE